MPSDIEALRKLREGDASGMNDLLVSYRLAAYNYLLLIQRRDHRLLEKFQSFFLGIPAMAQKRQVRADFATWYYRALMAAGEAYQTYVDEESLPVQKKLGELSLPLRQVVFFRHELNLPWSLLARIFRQSEERVRLAFHEALAALVPLLRGRNFPEEICRNLNGHLVAFLYHELEAAQKDEYQRHLASCAWCRARIRGVQTLFIEMEALSLEEPPALAIQNILNETSALVKRTGTTSRRIFYYGAATMVVLLAAGILFSRSREKRESPPKMLVAGKGEVSKSFPDRVPVGEKRTIVDAVADAGVKDDASQAGKTDDEGKIRGNFGRILLLPRKSDSEEEKPAENCDLPDGEFLQISRGFRSGEAPAPSPNDRVGVGPEAAEDSRPGGTEEFSTGSDGRYWVAVGQPGDIMDPQGRVMEGGLAVPASVESKIGKSSWVLPGNVVGGMIQALSAGLGEVSQDSQNQQSRMTDEMGGLLPLPSGLAGGREAWYSPSSPYETPHLSRSSRDNTCRSKSP